jgi:two-component system, chemotaxis family, CheB/CheR fusion protein
MNLPDPKSDSGEKSDLTTRVVGLGASAGGLEPLEQFLAHVPAASGRRVYCRAASRPDAQGDADRILQRATSMPVREVTASMRWNPTPSM